MHNFLKKKFGVQDFMFTQFDTKWRSHGIKFSHKIYGILFNASWTTVYISILTNIQSAVSMYCRLGFAKKKGAENVNTEELHPSWREIQPANKK